jgi:hypothetical protein
MYDLQRRALEKKVTAPPRCMQWDSDTMERWAFHSPGRGVDGAPDAWECIVEEGFQATLAGSNNGKV